MYIFTYSSTRGRSEIVVKMYIWHYIDCLGILSTEMIHDKVAGFALS